MRRSKTGFFLLIFMLCLTLSAGAGVSKVSAAESRTTSSLAKGGKWITVSSGKKYRYQNGSYAKSTWLQINGRYFYFNKKGLMAKNELIQTAGKTYYVKASGIRVTNMWVKKNGKTCYFGKTGARAEKQWVMRGKKEYYLGAKGTVLTKQWVKRNGRDYYLGSDGTVVKNQWVTKNKKEYYLGSDGTIEKNCWVKRNGKYYYLGKNGVILKNQWVDGNKYYVGKDGARTKTAGSASKTAAVKKKKVFHGDYIIVGDSRIVGMSSAVKKANTLYIAKVGEGHSWLKNTAGKELKAYLNTNPNVKVVLALGVNDLGNVQSYITYYKALVKTYPKTKFYVMSVNPVNEKIEAAYGYHVKNSSIEAFNKKMYKAFRTGYANVKYINTYKLIKQQGFTTRDGVHYHISDYEKLYKMIMEKIS